MTRLIICATAIISLGILYPISIIYAHEQSHDQKEEAAPGADHDPGHSGDDGPDLRELSKELKAALSKEMVDLEKNMTSLVGEIASGNWDAIAGIAEKISESYVMKQALTKEQMDELHHKLSEGFQQMDLQFHQYAKMLAHVAKEGSNDLVTFYFYKLAEGCMKCHSEYAKERFPNFMKKDDPTKHEHGHEHPAE